MPSIRLLDCNLPTYSYNITQFNPGAAATDIWQLQGVANVKTRIRYIQVGGTAAAVRTQSVALIKRSATSTAGTSTTPALQKFDSGDANPGAIVTQWSAAATPGASIGQVDSTTYTLTTGATAIAQDRAIFNYEQTTSKPIILESNAEFLCVNLAGVATVSGDRIDFEIYWTEGVG